MCSFINPLNEGGCQYMDVGRYVPTTYIDRRFETASHHHLLVRVTLPGCQNGSFKTSDPHPIVFFFNGFEARLSHYKRYAEHLASWGYAVVQYETGLLSLLNEQVELPYMEEILMELKDGTDPQSKAVQGRIDFGNVAVGGHSRGGKLAALHFARKPYLRACYLLDAVDNTKFAPESAAHPSATKEVQKGGRPLGLVGAHMIGSCNPQGSNWKFMWPRMPPGSWLTVVGGASHTSFLDAGFLLNRIFDGLCSRAHISRLEAFRLTVPGFLAWLEMHMRPESQEREGRLAEFTSWAARASAAAEISFSTLPEPPLPPASEPEDDGSFVEVPEAPATATQGDPAEISLGWEAVAKAGNGDKEQQEAGCPVGKKPEGDASGNRRSGLKWGGAWAHDGSVAGLGKEGDVDGPPSHSPQACGGGTGTTKGPDWAAEEARVTKSPAGERPHDGAGESPACGAEKSPGPASWEPHGEGGVVSHRLSSGSLAGAGSDGAIGEAWELVDAAQAKSGSAGQEALAKAGAAGQFSAPKAGDAGAVGPHPQSGDGHCSPCAQPGNAEERGEGWAAFLDMTDGARGSAGRRGPAVGAKQGAGGAEGAPQVTPDGLSASQEASGGLEVPSSPWGAKNRTGNAIGDLPAVPFAADVVGAPDGRGPDLHAGGEKSEAPARATPPEEPALSKADMAMADLGLIVNSLMEGCRGGGRGAETGAGMDEQVPGLLGGLEQGDGLLETDAPDVGNIVPFRKEVPSGLSGMAGPDAANRAKTVAELVSEADFW
eukprot:jgi/Botrbrau1/21899/Bobra.0249s0027.2